MNLTGTGEVPFKNNNKLTLQNFEISPSSLANSSMNMMMYNTMISGTSNTTTILRANSFASMGHYYGMSPEAQASVPNITNGGTIVAP